MRRHALISGAGIAGPALAHQLNARGRRTTVVERAPQLRDEGQNIDIRGAAREVVRRTGIEDSIRAAGTGGLGLRFVDDDGRLAYAEIHSDETAATCVGFLHRAAGFFATRYRPQTNGKAERFNRILLDEWAYQRPFTSNAERAAALPVWLHTYNHHRCHTAIGGQPPITRVNNAAGNYQLGVGVPPGGVEV